MEGNGLQQQSGDFFIELEFGVRRHQPSRMGKSGRYDEPILGVFVMLRQIHRHTRDFRCHRQ